MIGQRTTTLGFDTESSHITIYVIIAVKANDSLFGSETQVIFIHKTVLIIVQYVYIPPLSGTKLGTYTSAVNSNVS